MSVTCSLLADLGASSNLLIAIGCLAAAVVVATLVWLRYGLTRRRVTTRFVDFKTHVIQLRERVEAVKERHKLLPASDRDFQQAMTRL